MGIRLDSILYASQLLHPQEDEEKSLQAPPPREVVVSGAGQCNVLFIVVRKVGQDVISLACKHEGKQAEEP